MESAINGLMNGKLPGIKGVTADMLKEAGEMTTEAYIKLCNEIWKPGTWPSA